MYNNQEPSPITQHPYVNFFLFKLNLYPIRNEDTLIQDNHFIYIAYSLIIECNIFQFCS